MWREYSISYIKNNRASSISILAAAFISALFLSFLCSLFYGRGNHIGGRRLAGAYYMGYG